MVDFAHRQFQTEIAVEVDPNKLAWPERGAATQEGFGGNRHYFDIRAMGWREARRIQKVEADYINRIMAAGDPIAEADLIEEEMEAEWDAMGEHPLWGLDLGVAGTVFTLSAAGCIPFSSCNAGSFGSSYHPERYPLVAFFTRKRAVGTLCQAAQMSGTGLILNYDGSLQVFGQSVEALLDFADQLYLLRGQMKTSGGTMV